MGSRMVEKKKLRDEKRQRFPIGCSYANPEVAILHEREESHYLFVGPTKRRYLAQRQGKPLFSSSVIEIA
jgi:hypothetical protein